MTRRVVVRSKTERNELVAKWRASGQPVASFAAQLGIGASTLYQWIQSERRTERKKVGKAVAPRSLTSKPAFTEVSIVGQAAACGPMITVTLRNGNQVMFEGAAVEPGWLEAVLRAVSAC